METGTPVSTPVIHLLLQPPVKYECLIKLLVNQTNRDWFSLATTLTTLLVTCLLSSTSHLMGIVTLTWGTCNWSCISYLWGCQNRTLWVRYCGVILFAAGSLVISVTLVPMPAASVGLRLGTDFLAAGWFLSSFFLLLCYRWTLDPGSRCFFVPDWLGASCPPGSGSWLLVVIVLTLMNSPSTWSSKSKVSLASYSWGTMRALE